MIERARRRGREAALCFVLLAAAWGACAGTIDGVVFLDRDGDGVQGLSESGVAGVAVSDGVTVLRTDGDGRFALPLGEGARFVFVTVPSGTHATRGWYRAVADGGPIAFALEPRAAAGPLVFVQATDIHFAPNPAEFSEGLRDREMQILPDETLDAIVADVNALVPDFVILTGDLVADARYPSPERVDEWMAAVAERLASRFTVPTYAAVGNHDVVRDAAIGKSVYERHFGPTYYSFDVKGVHCVVLDLQQLVGTSLVYDVGATQLGWLREDLALVDEATPILVFAHEPTYDWAPTAENAALFQVLAEHSIAALVTGHWHTNALLRTEPFPEWTSGAVCGAWWEGPGPDGSGFGYRVFRSARGTLDAVWRTAGSNNVDIVLPDRAVLGWADRLEANVWGEARAASVRWDDEVPVTLVPFWNGLWSSVTANLNVARLADGYHTLWVDFVLADGSRVAGSKTFAVRNPAISLADIVGHPEAFQGRMVAAPDLEVRAVMGSDISGSDGTKTVIISKFPYAAKRGDHVGVVGLYHPTSVSPIKVFDALFFWIVGE